jgi:hypothetical protein
VAFPSIQVVGRTAQGCSVFKGLAATSRLAPRPRLLI